jgi:hypothetical protein
MLAAISATMGAAGVVIWLSATHDSGIAHALGRLPGGLLIGPFFLIGCLAIVSGILALVRIGGIAVSNFRPLGPGPF